MKECGVFEKLDALTQRVIFRPYQDLGRRAEEESPMAQKTRSNGQNPLESAADSLEKEVTRIQKQIQKGRRELEKRIERGRRQLVADVRKSPAYKRATTLRKDADKLRKDAEKQLESGVDNVLAMFNIASKRDLIKIDRRLRTLNKKLTDIEKSASA
jgi:hypothetical protein